MKNKEGLGILTRYLILIAVALPNFYLFYLIFTPLTVNLSYAILKSIYPGDVFLPLNNLLLVKRLFISLIPACIAGAAYYLLLALNLTTPMRAKQRTKSIIFLFGTFLILNVARIIIFIILVLKGSQYFDQAHYLTWYFGSTILVILIWFVNVKLFKIKKIPVYSDMQGLYKIAKKK